MILHRDSLTHSPFVHFFWVLASGSSTVASGLPSAKFNPLARISTYATGRIALTMDFIFQTVETLLQIHSRFFSQSINACGLPLSAVTVSLHCLTRNLRSTVTCKQNACYRNTKWTFEDLLPCYCYAMKTNWRTICSQLSYLPLQVKKGALLHDTRTVNLALVQCECYTGKWTVVARIKSIVQKINCWFQDF